MRTFDKQKLLRRVIFGLLVVLCALLQHTKGAFFHIGSIHAWLLVPAVVCIAMHEKSVPAGLFGAFAGVLWDCASVGSDGYYAVWLAVLGFGCSTLVALWIRNNLPAALLLCGGALCLTAVLRWLFFVVLPGTSAANDLFSYALPSALFTLIFALPMYEGVRFVSRKTAVPKNA